MPLGRRLLAAGAVALVLGLAAFAVPLHSGTDDCGSVVSPGPDSGAADCKDYQRVLVAGGAVLVVAGFGLLGVGWHVGRPATDEEEEPE